MRSSVFATLSAFAFLLCAFARWCFVKNASPAPLGDSEDEVVRRKCVHEARNVLNSLSLNLYLLDQLRERASDEAGDSWHETSAQCRRDVTQLRRLIDGLSSRGKEIRWTNENEVFAAARHPQKPRAHECLTVEECLIEGG